MSQRAPKFAMTARKSQGEASFQRDLGYCGNPRAAGCTKNAEEMSCETLTCTAMNNLTGSHRRTALRCPNEACCDKLDTGSYILWSYLLDFMQGDKMHTHIHKIILWSLYECKSYLCYWSTWYYSTVHVFGFDWYIPKHISAKHYLAAQ